MQFFTHISSIIMLHITKITEEYQNTLTGLLKRNLDENDLKLKLNRVIDLNLARKTNQQENDDLKSKLKELSDNIGILFNGTGFA